MPFKRPTNNRHNKQQNKPRNDPEMFGDFCEKKFLKLDRATCDSVFGILNKHFGFDKKQTTELNLNELTTEYMVTIKKENTHNFQLFLIEIDGKKYNIFVKNVNGRLAFYSVKFCFDDNLYRGTLFNGSMVKNQHGFWLYYINDILYLQNKYVQNYKMSKKLEIISDVLKNGYVYDDFLNVCHIQMDSYFLFNNVQFIEKTCKLVFIPEHYNMKSYHIVLRMDDEDKENVIPTGVKEFEMREMNIKEVFGLYENGKFVDIAYIRVKTYHMELVNRIKTSRVYVNCEYNSHMKSWEILE